MAAYSAAPVARNLSFKPGMRLAVLDMPATVRAEIAADLPGLDWLAYAADLDRLDAVHLFETEPARLTRNVQNARNQIVQNGQIWLSWPKRASKRPTDIIEDVLREVALPLGLIINVHGCFDANCDPR